MWLKEAHRRQMQKRTMTYYQTEKTEPILKIQHLILYRTFCCKDVFPVPEIYIYIYAFMFCPRFGIKATPFLSCVSPVFLGFPGDG